MFRDEQEIIQTLMEIMRPKPIERVAQTTQTVDPNAIKTLATKLLSNLEKNFGVSTEKSDTALYMKDLQNLDELLAFLRNEGVQYNNKWIVAQNYNTLSDEDKKLYVPYKLASEYEGFSATSQIGVYKDGLIGYLRSILDSAQKSGDAQGQLLITMVNKLINEANTKLQLGMAAQETTTQKATEQGAQQTETDKSQYKQTGYESGQEQAQLSPQQMQVIQPLITNMPLLGDRIDFPRLSKWLNDFSRINQDPNTAVDINNAIQIINNISSKYRIAAQPLAQEALQIARRVIQNASGSVAEKTNAPSAYLQQLSTLMSYIGAILGDFKNKIYDSLPDQEWRNLLDTQIGTDASSFYEINNDKIQTWLADLPDALQTMRTQGF
jgi:hypothetical protein